MPKELVVMVQSVITQFVDVQNTIKIVEEFVYTL
jgi:hypothetical protein